MNATAVTASTSLASPMIDIVSSAHYTRLSTAPSAADSRTAPFACNPSPRRRTYDGVIAADNAKRLGEVVDKVVGDGQRNPVRPVGGLVAQDRLTGLHVALQVSRLNLLHQGCNKTSVALPTTRGSFLSTQSGHHIESKQSKKSSSTEVTTATISIAIARSVTMQLPPWRQGSLCVFWPTGRHTFPRGIKPKVRSGRGPSVPKRRDQEALPTGVAVLRQQAAVQRRPKVSAEWGGVLSWTSALLALLSTLRP